MKAGQLTCNSLTNPLGVETPRPRLSWVLSAAQRGQRQTAYRVLVASSPQVLARDRGDLWDTGRVRSDRSIQVPYRGRKLGSRQACHWKVRVWDAAGRAAAWSAPACWEMGLLEPADWSAQWIRSAYTTIESLPNVPPPAPLLRRVVDLRKKVAQARAYVSGLGYYELTINGRRIGDEQLAPAFTRYDVAAMYQTHDVTAALRRGENVLGVVLGNGWYNGFTAEVWNFREAPWRDLPKLRLQLEVVFDDGERLTVRSDREWRGSSGPIVFDGLRNGEHYDARLERPGWDAPGYDDRDWLPAIVVPGPGGVMRSQQMTPIRIVATHAPITLHEVKPGVWIYDFGQNLAGWAQLRVQGPAGTTVTLRYAERLHADGDLDQEHLRCFVKSGDFQTDRYTLRGGGVEVWEPRFTYHGFRYVQMTGFPGTPDLESLRAREVHTAFESRGEFTCSNELLNTIQRHARWATLSNYHGIPTDCPHREKNGWTGDAQLSAEQVLLNFDPATAYAKWMADFRDLQRPSGQLPGIVPTGGWGFNWGSGPAWDSAAILIPWYLYVYGGDTATLEAQYDCMRRYVDYMETMATDDLVEFGLGDWCPPHGGPGGHKCPTAVTDTAYRYVDTLILSRVAGLLGKKSDARRYAALANRVREAFRRKFVNVETGQVTGNTQTSMACALYQGLVGGGEADRVLTALVAEVEARGRHIDCGILGAKYVMHALTEGSRADLAYAIATQTDYPSWGLWIRQGATTLWESWDGGTSRNHHMFSDISAWFYKGLAGLNPDPAAPGFKHFSVTPNPVGDLTFARARHVSPYGPIECAWRVEGPAFRLELSVPINTTATVRLPAADPATVRESGKPPAAQPGVRLGAWAGGRQTVNLESGRYVLTSRLAG
jgi:alpha-L-rhamnosidase